MAGRGLLLYPRRRCAATGSPARRTASTERSCRRRSTTRSARPRPTRHRAAGRRQRLRPSSRISPDVDDGRARFVVAGDDGFVMPNAAAHARRADEARRRSRARMERDVAVDRPAEFRVGAEQRRGEWIDYVQGVTAAMRARALPIRGFDARVESAVPLGAGLCSNAEAGACGSRARSAPRSISRSIRPTARGSPGTPKGALSRRADARFRAAGLSVRRRARRDRRGRRARAREYRVRREECAESARRLGVRALRDAGEQDVERPRLPAPLDRRARHVVTRERARLAARNALRRDVAAAFGARMTGGGPGGAARPGSPRRSE